MSALVLDTSVLLAVLLGEPTAVRLVSALAAADARSLSAASLLEAEIAATRRGGDALARQIDELLNALPVNVVDVTLAQAAIARSAYREFGKGRHPAALNFGDCFSSALAVERGEPLLFVGDDCSRTNVAAAPY